MIPYATPNEACLLYNFTLSPNNLVLVSEDVGKCWKLKMNASFVNEQNPWYRKS